MYINIDTDYFLGAEGIYRILNISGEAESGYIEITSSQVPGIIESKEDVVYNEASGNIEYKDDTYKKLEKLIKLQKSTLAIFDQLNQAIAIQQTRNNIVVAGGGTAVYTVSETDIVELCNYQNTVATFHESWDPTEYELEDINIGIFNGGVPELPDVVQRLLDV